MKIAFADALAKQRTGAAFYRAALSEKLRTLMQMKRGKLVAERDTRKTDGAMFNQHVSPETGLHIWSPSVLRCFDSYLISGVTMGIIDGGAQPNDFVRGGKKIDQKRSHSPEAFPANTTKDKPPCLLPSDFGVHMHAGATFTPGRLQMTIWQRAVWIIQVPVLFL